MRRYNYVKCDKCAGRTQKKRFCRSNFKNLAGYKPENNFVGLSK